MALGSCSFPGSRRSSSGLPGVTASDGNRFRVMAAGTGHTHHAQTALAELGGIAGQVATRAVVDELYPATQTCPPSSGYQ